MSVNDEKRGEDARRILESDMWKEAFTQLEANVVARMAQVSTSPQEAESLRQLLMAMHKVRRYWETQMQTGTMAALAEKQSKIQQLLRRRA